MALSVILALACSAQWSAHPPDHLRHLEGDTSVKARVELEMDRAGRWMVSNKALPHLYKSDSLFRSLTDTLGDAWFLICRSDHHYFMGYQMKFRRDIPAALKHFQLACAMDEEFGDPIRIGIRRDAIGVLLMAIGEHRLAEMEFRTALKFTTAKLEAPHEHLAYQGGHLVRCMAAQGRMEEAWQLWDSLYAVPGHIPGSAALLLEHRAHLHRLAMDKDAALADLLFADSLYQFAPYNWARLSSLSALARLHAERNEHHEALANARACIALADTLGDEAAGCGCRVLGAQAHAALGNVPRAERELLDALDIAKANGYMGLARELGDEGSMVHIAGLLKDLYNTQGRTSDALRMTTLWAAYKDTLHAMQGREDVMRFDLRKQVVTDSLLKAEVFMLERLAMQEELADQRERALWITGSGIGAVLLLSMLTYSFARRRVQERRLAALEMKRLEQERIIAEMHVREEVGRDMHDDLGAGLTALRLRSETALRKESDPEKRAQLAVLATQAGDLITTMRQLIWSMTTEEGDLPGTTARCQRYASDYLGENNIAANLHTDGPMPAIRLSAQQRRNLFLVLKEALHNIVKHAQATEVRLTFTWEEQLLIDLHDNGIGFRATAADDEGRGLANMRKRVADLHGTLLIEEDQGTRLRISIPLGTPNEHAIGTGNGASDLRTNAQC